MNSSSSPKEDAAGQGNERNIDLSGNGSADNSTVNANNQPSQQADTQTPTASNNTTSNDSIAPTENNGQETQQPARIKPR